jgi:hypothetical protein
MTNGKTPTQNPEKKAKGKVKTTKKNICWGGWIRNKELRLQRPVPYHLATPQYLFRLFCSFKRA